MSIAQKDSVTFKERIITFSFCESFIDSLTRFIKENYIDMHQDLSRLAVVFGGKRPALFLKRSLAKEVGQAYFSPQFFSIDEFIEYSVMKEESFQFVSDLDHCFNLFKLAQAICPPILKGRETFSQFLPWAQEIAAFIDQLDLEQVKNEHLRHIESHAQIGYAVPEDINRLLEHVILLREAYHQAILKEKKYSRGFLYMRAAQLIKDTDFKEFDEILFCNFFYFHRSEETVIKHLYKEGKARLILQGDERKWPVLKRISKEFSSLIREGETPQEPRFHLKLFSSFDNHSQAGLVGEILKGIEKKDQTVIVLPSSAMIVPLLSEITPWLKDFNISMGYPLRRSSLFSLFQLIFKAQLTRKEGRYYTKDYLRVLKHPFVKNLKIHEEAALTRIVIHKIEEILTGRTKTSLSGSLFIDLNELLQDEDLYLLCRDTLRHTPYSLTAGQIKNLLEHLHQLLFTHWQEIYHFHKFAEMMERFVKELMEKSFLQQYPLNLNIAIKILDIQEELKEAVFNREIFPQEEIFKIFINKVEREKVSFKGSPLKGLQILGLLETRSLNFENVIIVDVNEGVLPKLRIYEPLIPREVMIGLNLGRLELEEEIQRYQFMRLISSAKNVYLVYQESKDKERSRFVEELIWEEQKKNKKLDAVKVHRAFFEVKSPSTKRVVRKTPAMIEFLKNHTYSASSINAYVKDPLQFYYDYVLGLKEKDDLLDEPEAKQVGIFVHGLLEDTFKAFLKKKPAIDARFRESFFKKFQEKFEQSFGKSKTSDAFLLQSVLEERLKRFLDHEAFHEGRTIKEIMFLEHRFVDNVSLPCGEFKFQYILDRVDRLEDGTIRIIDYKTGSSDQMPRNLDKILTADLSRGLILEHIPSFQIPLYFYYLKKHFPHQPINAGLYNLKTLELHEFVSEKRVLSYEQMEEAFLKALNFILSEIMDPGVDFVLGEAAYDPF